MELSRARCSRSSWEEAEKVEPVVGFINSLRVGVLLKSSKLVVLLKSSSFGCFFSFPSLRNVCGTSFSLRVSPPPTL